MSKSDRTKRRPLPIKQTLSYVLLVLGAIWFILPFLWMVSTSLKDPSQVHLIPPVWIPRPARFQNYTEALTKLPFWKYLVNTCIITGICLAGQVGSASLVAFGFARFAFPGREVLFFVMLSTMMLPAVATLVPCYIIFKYLGWIDTFYPLTVPALLGGGPFYIFLMRQFFLTLPQELEDAAQIDGASWLGVYTRIFLPLSKPALTTVAIFSFVAHWNDFVGPLIYLRSPDRYTLAVGLQTFQGIYATSFHYLMAASVVVVLPVLVIFFIAQRYFVQGIVLTGIKS